MSALAKQDVDELADCSFVGTKSKEEVKEAWKRTFSYSKHFAFEWSSVAASQPDPNNGMVRLQVKGNANLPSSYEERFDLALRKVDGNWKVDVRAISREMYPFLPR